MKFWKSNPGPQLKVLRTKAYETLYGGARGGGKTDAGLVWLLKEIKNPTYRALVIRQHADDLSDWIDRAAQMYSKYRASIAYRPAVIRFPSGAVIKTGHLKDSLAYTKYQGHEYQRILIEELTQIPEEKRYLQLIASCRSTTDVDPRIFATTNPGNAGHHWVKRRFVDPAKPGTIFIGSDTKRTRIFIPSRIEDTPQLIENDPGYVDFLEGLKETDEELYKAWRLGDWETFAGQFFRTFDKKTHTTKPFEPPDSLPKYAGCDWGHTAPFVFLAGAVERVEHEDLDESFNRLWIYKEIDGTGRTPQEWAEEIKLEVDTGSFKWMMADPSIFIKAADGSRSIASQFNEADIDFLPANNDRVNGWVAVKNWLSVAPDGLPYLIINKQCKNLIRTLPVLVHDENHVEDVQTDGPDHWADALRYMVVHLNWIKADIGGVARPDITKPRTPYTMDLDKFK